MTKKTITKAPKSDPRKGIIKVPRKVGKNPRKYA